jgi:hypothetical protein
VSEADEEEEMDEVRDWDELSETIDSGEDAVDTLVASDERRVGT